MVETSRKILIKYYPENVGSSFWQELYGYSKGKYEYPGLLDEIPGADKLAKTLIVVPEDEAERVKGFLREHGAKFEEKGLVSVVPEAREELTRWDAPMKVFKERLKELGEKMDKLGPFIVSESRRNALADVERYGY